MDSLSNRMIELREHVSPDWNDARSEALLREIRLRQSANQQQRRRSTLSLGLGAAIAACVAIFVPLSTSNPEQSPSREYAAAESLDGPSATTNGKSRREQARYYGAGRVALADGSNTQTFADSELAVFSNSADRVRLTLVQGRARFDVVKRSGREFSVQAGNVTVTVLGTVFEVAHSETGVRIGVERGRVQVTRGAETYFVATGQQLLVPGSGEAHSSPIAVDGVSDPADGESSPQSFVDGSTHIRSKKTRPGYRSARAKQKARNLVESDTSEWRAQAKAGNYQAAYREVRKRMHKAPSWDPNTLLDAADAARFSGHPIAAIAFLEQVTKIRPGSPMAPLAAFTLGRVCLDQLGRPHRAAAAFGLALALAPDGSLAQDALARQVEALSKGGRETEAFTRARAYVQKYPQGRRLHAVRKYGGVE